MCIRHTGSRAVALSHLDGSAISDALSSMVMSIQAMTNPKDDQLGKLELHIIGGYKDHEKASEQITSEILNAASQREEMVNSHVFFLKTSSYNRSKNNYHRL